jgi:ABC-type uncharacterized transport system auxiliary subunit
MHSRRALLGAGLALPLAACTDALQQPYPEKRSYVLRAERPQKATAPANGPVLGMRRFRVSPGYDGRGIVTRTDALTQKSDFYNEFFVPPGNMMEEIVGSWLRDSGLFASVVPALSQLTPTHALEGTLVSLYGDFGATPPQAVIELQLLVLDIQDTRNRVTAKGDYRQAVPIPARTPDALVRGWSDALAQIMAQFEGELRGKV